MAFDPSKLRYKADGVPYLSAREIEAIADEVLQKHDSLALQKPKRPIVIEILNQISETKGLRLGFEDLGHRNQKKVLGKMQFPTKSILLDPLLLTELKQCLLFTAAHELGHWVLHSYAWRTFWTKDLDSESLVDDDESLFRLQQRSRSDWLEWQANVFAAELVMPRATFPNAVVAIQTELGITKNLGQVWLSQNHRSWTDYSILLGGLAAFFDVSKSSVEVRLKTLELLHDETAATRPFAA